MSAQQFSPAVVQVVAKAAAAEACFERLSEALGAEKQTCKALRAELLSSKAAAEGQLSRLRIELDAKQVSGMPGNQSRLQGCALLAVSYWQQQAADNTMLGLCLSVHSQPGCLHPSSVPCQGYLHPSSGPGPGRELRDTARQSPPLRYCMVSQAGLLVQEAKTMPPQSGAAEGPERQGACGQVGCRRRQDRAARGTRQPDGRGQHGCRPEARTEGAAAHG